MMPCTPDLLVSSAYFDVNSSQTSSKVGSPGRSVFGNCFSAQRDDALSFISVFITGVTGEGGRGQMPQAALLWGQHFGEIVLLKQHSYIFIRCGLREF